MNKPNKIIIHHSLTADNKVLSSFEAIKKYHIEVKKWNDIGYHYVIEYVNNKPNLRTGRREIYAGAHTQGQNEQSIGICVVGNFDIEKPTKEIIFMLASLIRSIRIRHGKLPIHYHREFTNKTCPGKLFISEFDLEKEVEGLFNDIVGHWAQEAIREAEKLGLVFGYEDNNFRPDREITRAEATTMILNLYKILKK